MPTSQKTFRRGHARALAGVALLAVPLAACGPIAFADDSALVIVGTPPAPEPEPEPEPAPEPPPKPKKVVVKGDRIEITEKIQFEYAKADIKEESHGLLNDIVDVLKENDQIDEVSIEGHTDSDGKAKYNKKLSQQRAEAVRKYLVEHGIEESRLVSKGWGLEKPIGDNKTEEGKEANRRVEFIITKQHDVQHEYVVDPKTGEKKRVGTKVLKKKDAAPAEEEN